MTRDEALALLSDIDSCGKGVSDWEAEFIDSLLRQAENDWWQPTERQAAKIMQLHEQYCAGGF